MKVLQVSKFYPPDLGGIEAVARDLSAGFVRHGLQVQVLCAAKQRATAHEVDELGVAITRAGSLGMWLSTSMAPALVRELWGRRHDADVMHVHMPDPLAALAVYAVRPRVPVVVHWHSDVVRQRIARHVYRPLEQWLLRRADAVVATSQAYADSSAALAPWRDKLAVIPIGTPAPQPADPERVRRLRARYDGRRVVFALGRMTHYKGWQVLMRASRQLPPDVQVVIGGGGPELPRFRAMVERLRVQDRVELTGPLSPALLEAHFAVADLFCMPSTNRAEAYGVAALEAMARGLPVVASAIPGSGLGWLHQDGLTGVQVPPGEPRVLAQALSTLLADAPLRARLGQAGQARWAAYFTADTMADETVALYHRLVAAAASPGPRQDT